MTRKKVVILGIRGVPAKHGGFETFAEKLSFYLVGKGWDVTVYCQESDSGHIWEDVWRGVRRVHIPARAKGAMGTIVFDWKSTLDAMRQDAVLLTLGYNTAVFCLLYRLQGRRNLINMDGIEWRREKWGFPQRSWLYMNERLGCWLGNHLIADHPEIAKHLATRVSSKKITVIPYGADELSNMSPAFIGELGLKKRQYALVIGRPEPENSILEIVRAYSRKRRGIALIILGEYHPDRNQFHRQVISAASEEVVFLGAIYDKHKVEALRFYCLLYIHGHRVGGTNPSLVEALGAGSPVLAHDNVFNRWVAGTGSHYFRDENECAAEFDDLLNDDAELERMRSASKRRHLEDFSWKTVLEKYEFLLGCFAKTGG